MAGSLKFINMEVLIRHLVGKIFSKRIRKTLCLLETSEYLFLVLNILFVSCFLLHLIALSQIIQSSETHRNKWKQILDAIIFSSHRLKIIPIIHKIMFTDSFTFKTMETKICYFFHKISVWVCSDWLTY